MKALPPPKEDLVDFINRKESKERQRRIITAFVGIFVVSTLSIIVAVKYLDIQQGPPLPEIRTYQLEELTRSQVASLFKEDPRPILLEDKTLGRVDTIRNEREYMLVLASIHDETLSLNNNGTLEVQETSDLESMNFRDSVRRRDIDEFSEPFTEADVMPEFPGGEPALYRFLSGQIRYPEDALRNKVEGKVFVRFVIQADGSLKDLKIVKGIGHGCDEEALRVIRLMPAWIPGEIAGQKVPVYSSLAVNFKFF
ncbi:MAG: energy transducer TonB [Bacteroidota bacterium]